METHVHTFLPNNPFVPPKGGICLIKNLPLELLSYIFTFGSTDSDDSIENEDEDTRYNPLDAKMANEKDTHDHHDHQTTDDQKEGEGAFAESESSNVLLPFTFVISHIRQCFKLPSPADFEFLLAMLIPHIHRWRRMEVTAPTEQLMQEILSAVSDPSVPAASQLTTLELHDLQHMVLYDGLSVLKHLTLFGGSAPLLTRIVLWRVHVDWDQPWIASASNLTDLVLAYHPEAARPSLAQFSAILRNAPALEKFQASCSSLSGLESLKIARLHCSDECIMTLYGALQNLRSLNLSLFYLDPLFLDILCTPCTLPGRGNIWLPRLVRLYLSGTSGCPLREFVSKRREVGAPLSSLSVEGACVVDDGDAGWFKENLKKFEVFEGSDAGDDGGWNEDVNED
ncbi:hypothetical protein JVT61DRAFT_11741 [Boletus reticuloceps]|uniref:F-box domain-containing protein n=1 Tax=Boletus reticuloceps TaxID=495285 RepID=A0A8I2YVR8_9AGAM|nr:hypothetical protein JVT61DRAFT_11741 [Boletus reticuloceps]